MGTHVARADVTGVDRRPARGEQRNKRSLRPLQAESDLIVAIGNDLFEVAVPGFARVDAQLLGRFAGDQVPVHLTSAAVNGLPSCHLTPSRSLKVSSFPSSLHDQLEARSETIELRVFCGTCWSNITRLLNTPIIGPSTTIVDSSWIDTLAMLVPSGILRTPPDFCAKAGWLAHRPPSAPHATNKLRSFAFICLRPSRRVGSPAPFHGLIFGWRGLFVEPDVL